MITQRAVNFAKVLESLDVPKNDVEQVRNLLTEVEQVAEVLDNPLVRWEEKKGVIKSLMPESMWKFMRLLCDHHCVSIQKDIFEAYEDLVLEKQGQIKATLRYAMKLDSEDIEQVEDMICKKYNKTGVKLELIEDSSLISGMVLKVRGEEFDKSARGTLEELQKTLVRR